MRTSVSLRTIFLALILLAACGKQAEASGVPAIQEVVLDTTTDPVNAETLYYAPDLASVAIIKKAGNEWAVTWQSVTGNSLYYVPVIAWQSDFRPGVALELHGSADDGSWLMGLRGSPGSTCGLVFSPDSKRLAYVGAVKKGGTDKTARVVVVDGKVSEEYEEIYPHHLAFSHDSKCFSYIASRGGKRFLVAERKTAQPIEGKPSFMLLEIQYSSDNRHLVWIDNQYGEGAAVVFDGMKGKIYENIVGLSFAPKSSICAYVAETKDDKYVVVVGEKESAQYDGILNTKVYWSPEGEDYAYVAGRKGASGMEAVLVRNGLEQAKGYSFRAVTYSPDGKRFAYGIVAPDEKGILKGSVVVDGKVSRHYDGLGEYGFFSPDSKRFAYIGATMSASGKGIDSFFVVDGKQDETFKAVEKQLAWSPDSTHYAYCAFRGDTTVVVRDGKISGTYSEALLPAFSFDSGHLVWWAKMNDKWHVVVDGQSVSKPFDAWLARNWVANSKGLRGIGLRGRDVIRVDIKWKD
jgi:hypothetical protein